MERLVISQNERLMLSLLELDRYRDSAEVPMSLSQEGIARDLKTQVHNISRALSSLEADGLVTDRLAHVRGAPRRRRAYFLTEKGRRTAESIREGVLGEMVAWAGDGKPESLPVAEAIRRVSVSNGRTPSIIEVIDRVRAGATLAPQDFADRSSHSEASGVVVQSLGRPMVGQFFGRSEVLARLMDSVRGESVSTILVHGMPGIGKSTLLSKVFDDLSEGMNLFWYSLSQWDTDKTVADQLASFLSSCGRRSLARAMKSALPTAEVYSPLLSDLRGLDSVIFLDDVHKASDRLELLISMLMDAARVSKSAKLVLISRTVPGYVPRDIRQSLHIELKELDRESARQLVQSSSDGVAEDVYGWARGNPLLLTLISKKGVSAERRDVISFIDSEVYSTLTDGQRDVLELLSAFRHPVPMSDLSEDDSREAAGLRAKSLVVEQESGIWVHDLLRDYFSSRLSSERRARAHLKASGYCATREEPEWRLEALYHLVEAGAWAEAASFVVAKFDSLSRDFPEEALELLSGGNEERIEADALCSVLYARASLADALGHQSRALLDYERCMDIMPDSDPLRPAALESLARLRAEYEQWTKSLEAHEEARALYERADDVEGQVREWLNLGLLHKRRGDLEGTRECYDRALSIATKAENRLAQAACMNNLALLHWESGDPGDAERMLREAIRLAHAAEDHMGEGRALENLSQFCRGYLRMDESANLLLEASTAYAMAGDLSESKRAKANHAEALADLGDYEGAISACRSALADPSLRRRRGLFQERSKRDSGDFALMLALATLLRLTGEYGEAREELVALAEDATDSGDPSLLAKAKLEGAMIEESAGDLDNARSILVEAEGLLVREVDREGLTAVYLRMGIVSEKKGDLEKAAECYRSAIRQAEMTGNAKARTIAAESLESLSAAQGL